MNEKQAEVYVGIDISKTKLDVAIGQEGEYWQANNDGIGIGKTVERLQALQPSLIVVESTGGLEIPLITELYATGLPFALVHPARVRDFARSIGLLAKTDKLDARLLAHFAAAIQPPLSRLPGEAEQYLNALLLRRRQILNVLLLHLLQGENKQFLRLRAACDEDFIGISYRDALRRVAIGQVGVGVNIDDFQRD